MQAKWLENLGQFTKQNSPTILSGIAVMGVAATAVLAARAAVNADKRLHPEAGMPGSGKPEPDGFFEQTKAVWTLYIPAGLSGLATIACIIGANQIGARRSAAMVAAYSLVDQSFREYKDKVVEQLGKAKEQKIGDAIMEDRIKQDSEKQVVIIGTGDQPCFDAFTGRYFRSDMESIRRAENEINRRVLSEYGVPLDDFYELLGLESTLAGQTLGWDPDHMLTCVFSTHLRTDTGEPCIAIRFERMPVKDFGKVF